MKIVGVTINSFSEVPHNVKRENNAIEVLNNHLVFKG